MKDATEIKNFLEEFDEILYDQNPDFKPDSKADLLSVLRDCLKRDYLYEMNIINGLKMLNATISKDISSCFFTAPMQSGKTKTLLSAIIIGSFLFNRGIRCIFTSSLPRNKAFEQNKKIINKANSILKKYHNQDEEFVKALKLDFIQKDLFNKGNSKSNNIVQNFLNEKGGSCFKIVFIDESHHGSGDDSKLHECVQALYEVYGYSGINFIYNTATNYDPAVMLSNIFPAHEDGLLPPSIVVHAEVAETYYGLKHLLEDSILTETKTGLDKKPKFFYSELHSLIDHAENQAELNGIGSLIMVRIDPSLSDKNKRSNQEAQKIKEHIGSAFPNIKAIAMNSSSGNNKFQPIEDDIKKGEIVLVIVTGFLSASDDLGIFLKKHVVGILETFKSVQGIAQGLVGRVLGHNVAPVHKRMIISKIKYIKVALALQENPDAMRKSGALLSKIIQDNGIAESELYDNTINLSTNTSFRYRSTIVDPSRLFVITPEPINTYLMNGAKKNNNNLRRLLKKEALNHKNFIDPHLLSWTHPYIQDRPGGTTSLFLNNTFRSSSGNRAWPLHDKSLRWAPTSDIKNFDVDQYNNGADQIKNLIYDPSTYPNIYENLKENIIKIDSTGKVLDEEISDLDIEKALEKQCIVCIDGVISHDHMRVSERSITKSLRTKSFIIQEIKKETEHRQLMLELGDY